MSATALADDFAHEVVPVLKKHCVECHTGDKKKGGFSMNDRAALLAGGENGKVIVPGDAGASKLMGFVRSQDPDSQMPPKGPRLDAREIGILQRWIDGGLAWEAGFAFQKPSYDPPLRPRRPTLPEAAGGRENPVDRFLDAALIKERRGRAALLTDGAFLRRSSLDLIGLLPTAEELAAFTADPDPDKRRKLIAALLARDQDYAEHWLTFWNDLLRNDYTGTGFITGGRTQITKWLYDALITNKPFDQFTRELIAPPTPESAGFAAGIQWRGEVSAGQSVEIQFAQSIGQAFLGINLKCASCHDSFIDRWKLDEAFSVAAVYATQPLEIHRCDKPVGRKARAGWLFPELGQIDPDAPQPERLQQLASLLTHPENGRYTRTMVNRLWHRLMGRGIVHPVDAMQTEPWNADLLDYLACHLQDSGYDLKKTLELIATSAAYQEEAEARQPEEAQTRYQYAGPRAKRMTAEQFVDAVWQLTGMAPQSFEAAVTRGKPDPAGVRAQVLTGKWIWASEPPAGDTPPAGQKVTLRKTWNLPEVPARAGVVLTADNEYELYVNGRKVGADGEWGTVELFDLQNHLTNGPNEILLVAGNGGGDPNPAAAYLEASAHTGDGKEWRLSTDDSWQWTAGGPDADGKFPGEPAWHDAVIVAGPWAAAVDAELKSKLAHAASGTTRMVRASLVKSDFLMRTLGRPNREQIVSERPAELTTLEAMDLANGAIFSEALARGAAQLLKRTWAGPDHFTGWLYRAGLGRDPSTEELAVARESLGPALTEQNIQDVVWMVCTLPEFQFVR
jgi:hypothetical protein